MTNHKQSIIFKESRLTTPIGELIILLNKDNQLCAIDWMDFQERLLRLLHTYYKGYDFIHQNESNDNPHVNAIKNYFDGDIHAIDSLPTDTLGTPFQQQVWQALRTIPAGKPTSYGAIAEQINNPKAVRAVGMANGANPISIVVPCHRVIGKNNKLVGYGGGLERKKWLLDHEHHYKSQ